MSKEPSEIILEINEDGNVLCLWTDDIDLFDVGLITNVHKASDVDFNQEEQIWEVLSLDRKVLHKNKNRDKAIEFEIKEFSPGGKYYEDKIN